jgi:hypothetical protein
VDAALTTAARIGLVGGGASYHERTLADQRFASVLTKALYLPALTQADIEDLDVVVLADRLHPAVLAQAAPVLAGFVERGGTLMVLGQNDVHTWLGGVGWEPRPTNFWWWREDADSHIRARHPEHPLWAVAAEADLVWHFHGVLHPPAGTMPLLVVEEEDGEGVLLYEDLVSSPGRLIVGTLDPVYHHGSNFMPAATRCLEVLLAWLGTKS